MPNYTENLQLEKPLQSEQYNVDVFNANADKIDQFAGQTPARALTADKLTTGAKINGVNFKGDTNVITGLGLHSSTEVYAQNNLAYKVIDDNVVVKRSLVNGNTGDNFDDSDYWEDVELGGGSGYQLFDIVMKDHVLDYAETLGFAPLGTYVYRDAIAGSRYGYPDFYQKLVDEYNDGTSAYMSSNINIVGSLIDNDGVLSGFSSTSWAVLPENFTPSTNNWAITVKFKTGTIGTAQNVVNSSSIAYQPFDIHIDANGNILSEGFVSNTSTVLYLITGTTVLTANTDYYVQLEYNSSAGYTLKLSTDGVTFTTEGTSAVTTPINGGNNIALGADFAAGGVYYGEAFTGSIDLNESYINIDGTRWWTGTNTCIQNSNKHRFYDIADKATFDNIFGITGECWYYGIDTTNERVFLPRSTRFRNGTTSDVGGYNPAGLPNIEGTFYIRSNSDASAGIALTTRPGAIYTDIHSTTVTETINSINTSSTARRPDMIGFDASLSNSIYGASDTVEYSSTKLIPYMVVGNTANWAGMSDVVNQGMDILSQVANKATTDLDNLTNAGKIAIAHNAMPSDTYTDLTLPASNTSMVAPADGYVNLSKRASSSGQYIYLGSFDTSNNELVEYNCIAPANTTLMHVSLPVRKGQSFIVGYTAGGALDSFRFVYAQGSESEAL